MTPPPDAPAPRLLFDFRDPEAAAAWFAIDDGVMGGRSRSGLLATTDGTALFAGVVSLENGGGFASVRAANPGPNLAVYDALRLRLRGDGHTYKLSLKSTRDFDGVLYQASFATVADVWEEFDIPLDGFRPTFRGRPVPQAGPLDRARVETVGLMISEKQAGPFRLEIAWIAAVASG